MKLIISLIISFLSISVFAQNNNDFFEDTLSRVSISTTIDFNYGSDVISNKFLNRFIFGGKIDTDLKNDAFDRLSNSNRLGGDFNHNLNIEIPIDTLFKRTDLSLFFGVGQREHIDAQFGEEIFKFTFDGNKQFAGETIDISDIIYNYYKYQEIQFGIIKTKKNKGRIVKKGFILSAIKAQEHRQIDIPRGSLFTEELGREIELDLKYIYNESDTVNKGFSAFNGFGASADLFAEFFFKNGDKIYIGAEDLGFIYWNNQSIQNETDSTFNYQGVTINNIFDINDNLLSDISTDSILENTSIINEKSSFSIALPAALNINYTKYFNNKIKLNLGFYHRVLSSYFPLFYTNTYYYFNKSIALKAHISYGGYGQLNTGLALAASIKNKYHFFLGSNNIEAFIAPNSSFANSSYLGLKVYF